MKSTITLFLFFLVGDIFAQNISVKGYVKDTDGNAIMGAVIRANMSKITAQTDDKGFYSIIVSDKDKTLRLSIPNVESMSKRISADKDVQTIDFDVFIPDVEKNGQMSADFKTYYVGENDDTFFKMIDEYFSNCSYGNGYVSIRTQRCTYYEVDGAMVDNLFSVDPRTVYSITILKDVADCVIYGGRAMYGAVLVKTKIGKNAPKGVKVQMSSSVSTGI